MKYYRLACGDKIEIEGMQYYEIRQYSSFRMPEDALVVAYMREENGKVYARYRDDIGIPAHNYYGLDTEEHLLYDFNMNEGDVIILDSGGFGEGYLTLKCVETGTVVIDGISRRYLRFDRKVNSETEWWMTYKYLVEGVGPVGNCNFTIPYRTETAATMFSQFQDIRLLYQREVLPIRESEKQMQGRMLYRSAYFDLFGVCDSSVFYWASTCADVLSPVRHNVEDLDIKLRWIDGTYHIINKNKVLKEVVVYNVIGERLDTFYPESNDFEINSKIYDENLLVTAKTENGSRTFPFDYYGGY